MDQPSTVNVIDALILKLCSLEDSLTRDQCKKLSQITSKRIRVLDKSYSQILKETCEKYKWTMISQYYGKTWTVIVKTPFAHISVKECVHRAKRPHQTLKREAKQRACHQVVIALAPHIQRVGGLTEVNNGSIKRRFSI